MGNSHNFRHTTYRKETDDKAGQGRTLKALSDLERDLNNLEKAEEHCREALKIQRQLNDKRGVTLSYHAIALLEERQGNLYGSNRTMQDAEKLAMTISASQGEQMRQKREKHKSDKPC